MKLQGYLFFFIFIIAAKAEDEKKDFVEVTTLNNLKSYLSNGINETEKCYKEIIKEYGNEIDDFHQKIKNVLIEISKQTWGPVDYRNHARIAFAELKNISEKMIKFKTLLSNSFIKGVTKDAVELAVAMKKSVDGHYTKYLQIKNMFKAHPHRGFATFMKFDQKYRVEVYHKFKPISDRFKSCNDKNRKVQLCPYEKAEFINIISFGNIEGSFKMDLKVKDPLIPSACYKEFGDDYKEGLDLFYSSMKNGSEALRKLFSSFEVQNRNNAYLAGLELQNLGTKMKYFETLLRKSFDTADFKNLIKYSKEQKRSAELYYGQFSKFMKHFDGKRHRREKDVKNIIHKHCIQGTNKMERAFKNYEICIKRRINETKSYFESIKGSCKN